MDALAIGYSEDRFGLASRGTGSKKINATLPNAMGGILLLTLKEIGLQTT